MVWNYNKENIEVKLKFISSKLDYNSINSDFIINIALGSACNDIIINITISDKKNEGHGLSCSLRVFGTHFF